MIKKISSYILIFLFTLEVLLGLLVLAAMIPRDSIRDNVKESAEYYCDRGLFTRKLEGVNASAVDHYADSILVAIAYQYDEENPLESVMWSSYYNDPSKNENTNLLTAVAEGKEANQQYLRYWHGSNTIVKPLLTCFTVKEIYILNAVAIGLLAIALIMLLVVKKAYTPAAAFALGLIATSVWFVPTTFEYTWNYMLMLIISIIGVAMSFKGKWYGVGYLFLLSGMLTNYFDFLSTETITLTVPLLLMLWIRDKNSLDNDTKISKNENITPRDYKKEILMFAGKNTLLWGIGYVGMWISKWVVAAIVLGENTLPYVTVHISQRLDGDVGLNKFEYIYASLARNIKCLLPFEYGAGGVLLGVGLIVFAFYLGYVHYGKKVDKKYITVYGLSALIPYIRFVVLHNHAYLHYFFTYRAQMATIIAVVFILELLTDRRWLAHGKTKRRKP